MEKLKLTKNKIKEIKQNIGNEIFSLIKSYLYIKNKDYGFFCKRIKIENYKLIYSSEWDEIARQEFYHFKIKYKNKKLASFSKHRFCSGIGTKKFDTKNIFLLTEFVELFKQYIREEEEKQAIILESQLEVIQAYRGIK